MKTYAIKPLEWIKTIHNSGKWTQTVFGKMSVIEDDGGDWRWSWCFDEFYDYGSEECEGIEDGIAKAETFYLERIKQALLEVGGDG